MTGSPLLDITIVMLLGAFAGALGALLGLGAGVFVMPFLVLVMGIPLREAVAISLTTVIATSTAVSAGTAGRQLINLRLGTVLEVATALGGLTGGITAQYLSDRVLYLLFALVTASVALLVILRLERRNVILDREIDPGRLGGRFYEHESGADVTYRVRRLPLALAVSFAAGNLSSLLGIGGGILKVPALNALCGVPLRAAAATSAFMIGVTAAAALPIYYARGDLVPHLAAATVLGVLVGSATGLTFGERARAKWLKMLMAAVLLLVSGMMISRW
jgi:uncharacterized membrane protein YfcA